MLIYLKKKSIFCKIALQNMQKKKKTFCYKLCAPHLVIHVSSYETFQMGVQNEATSFCCLLMRHQQRWLHNDIQMRMIE